MTAAILIFALLAPALNQAGGADDPTAIFNRANELYEKQLDYAGAAELYERILAAGVKNWLVEYNLGNASYRLGRIGWARLHYERAALLNPRDEDLWANIGLIEKGLNPTLREENFAAVEAVLWRTAAAFPQPLTLALGMAAFILLNLVIMLNILKPGALHPAAFWAIIIALALSAAAGIGISAAADLLAEAGTYGIVVRPSIEVTSEPRADAPGHFPAPEGMKVILSRRQGDWAEIVLPNSSKGWVPGDAVALISETEALQVSR